MADGGCVFVPPFFAGGLKVSTLRRLWDGMGWDDGDDAWRYQVISTTTTYFFFCYCFSLFLLFLPISSFTTTITLGRFWDWDWDWVGLWNGMERNEFGFG
jgi:hypothetical protein